MAAIDFPASPTTGQLFSAANGVTYRYNGTLWLVQAGPGGGTGEVTVVDGTSGNGLPINTDSVLPFNTVKAGNAGGWWSSSTFRYTPPAGKYLIAISYTNYISGGGTGSWLLKLRKNGNAVTAAVPVFTTGGAAWTAAATLVAYVDANGTDYFDATANPNISGCTTYGGTFTAIPLTGMQGVQGPPGSVPTGDFFATMGYPATNVGVTFTTVTPPVISGNAGGWYNATTGRYTPPPGRYFLHADVSGNSSTAALGYLGVQLSKNGVVVQDNYGMTGYGYYAAPGVDAVLDANGSDWFEAQFNCNPTSTTMDSITFLAYPISGVKGPQGDIGPAGGAPNRPKVTKFFANGTFTPDINCVYGYVEGKAGGGAAYPISGIAGYADGGGGGAEGNTVTTYFTLAQVTPTVAVTVGAGGSGLVASAGSDTIFGTLLTAKGGGPGSSYTGGMANAVGNVGDIVRYGAPGSTGMHTSNTVSFGYGGPGGGGGGGAGGVSSGGGAGGAPGLTNSGGGAGGTASSGGGGPYGAADGGSGYLTVVEYLK